MRIILYFIVLSCGLLLLGKRPLVSPANLLFIYMTAAIVLGDILLPLSLLTDSTSPTPAMISSLNLHLYLNVAAFLTMAAGFLLARRTAKTGSSQVFLSGIELSAPRLFIICLFYYVAGASLLLLTFHATDTIPLLAGEEAKQFRHVTSAYLPYRPFYVLAIDVIAMATLFTAYLATRSYSEKRYSRVLLCACLTMVMLSTTLLTGKRGESIMPLFVLIGTFAIARKIRLHSLVILTGIMFISIILVTNWIPSIKAIRNIEIDKKTRFVPGKLTEKVTRLERVEKGKWLARSYDRAGQDGVIPRNRFSLTDEQKRLIRSGPGADTIERVSNSLFMETREGGRLLNYFKGHNLLLGKTYLAGLISLVPTRYSSFKDHYVIGRVSMRLFGGNPDTAGGPQIGYVAESYINLGIAGVLAVAFIFGFFIHRLDRWYLGLYNSDAKEKMLLMVLVFLVVLLSRGFFTNGSGVFQAVMVRVGLLLPMYWFAIRSVTARKISDEATFDLGVRSDVR